MIKFKVVISLYYITYNVLLTEANEEQKINYMCEPKMSDIETNEPIRNLAEYCKGLSKKCVPKCCKKDEVVYTTAKDEGPVNCTSWSKLGITSADYSILKVYEASIEQEKRVTRMKFLEDFHLVYNGMFENETCVETLSFTHTYLLENGMSAIDLLKFGEGWEINEQEFFCVDLNVDGHNTSVVFYSAKQVNEIDEPTQSTFLYVSLWISSAFLVLVFLVYCVLPQLRNLSGMLLMAYVATQCLTFLLEPLFTEYSQLFPSQSLYAIVCMFYFASLSSFCWLNIMSFDIWWTFRGHRLKRAINGRGELVKFGWYSLYGWGAPLAVTILAVVIDINRDKLPYITPFRFDLVLRNKESVRYYIYYPMGMMTLVNVILFCMTIYNIWLIKKSLSTTFNENSKRNTNNNENRIWLYMKLSMLMGVSWLIELYQALQDTELPNWLYILINLYNALIGVVIFIMFVLNRKTLKMLCKRFNIRCRFLEDKEYSPNRSTTKTLNINGSFHTSGASGTYETDVEMSNIEVNTNPNPKIK